MGLVWAQSIGLADVLRNTVLETLGQLREAPFQSCGQCCAQSCGQSCGGCGLVGYCDTAGSSSLGMRIHSTG